MTCFYPVRAYHIEGYGASALVILRNFDHNTPRFKIDLDRRFELGKTEPVLLDGMPGDDEDSVEGVGTFLHLPCSRCEGCLLDRSRMWALRCMHEASLHEKNCFITLTYNNEHLPKDGSLKKEHFQKFMKRLRFRLGKSVGEAVRYFHCGEYGAKLGRPHYHALLFGYDFPDKRVHSVNPVTGLSLYVSDMLQELWPFGYSSVGTVTMASAGYVARYSLKKRFGDEAKDHYGVRRVEIGSQEKREVKVYRPFSVKSVENSVEIVPHGDVSYFTGEIDYRFVKPEKIVWRLTPEYVTMSRRPGIGRGWLVKYKDDVYPHDFVVCSNGFKNRVPRYYDGVLELIDPNMYDIVKGERKKKFSDISSDEYTPERLAAKREVFLSRINRLKRVLT
jgi:hypothetical protein